jgi:transcriptional regulator with XRE-family HTH domain
MNSAAFNKAIGAVLERERKVRGLTLEALGKVLDVSYQQIQKFTSGTNGCSAYQLQLFADAFELPVAYIYEQAGIKRPLSPPRPEDNDAFLAARYVSRITDEKLRGNIVDFTRKLAYRGDAA